MTKKIIAVITIILITVFFGCDEILTPPGEFSGSQNTGGNGGGSTTVVPGSGGRTIGPWLDQSYNADPSAGKPGMRISALTQGDVNPEELTTQKTLGLWEDGKFHIEGIGAQFGGGFQNAGFVDVLLLYYDQPFEEEFKISARIRVRRTNGVSTSKGIHFGSYAPRLDREPTITDNDGVTVPNWGANQDSKGFGLFLRAESMPQFRLYYSDQYASTTAGNASLLNPDLLNVTLTKEYIYEVARLKIDRALPFSEDNAYYEYQLLDSKTYLPVVYRGTPGRPVALTPAATTSQPDQMVRTITNPPVVKNPTVPAPAITATDPTADGQYLGYNIPIGGLKLTAEKHPVGGASIQINPAVRGKVYAGICISASVAEISQIKIWESTDDNPRQMEWNYLIKDDEGNAVGSGDEPLFKTPDTIPAYVPANFITYPNQRDASRPLTRVEPSKAPTVDVNDDPIFLNGAHVYRWSSQSTPGQWGSSSGGLVAANYTIRIIPYPSPNFAHSAIHYQIFSVGTVHPAFIKNDGKLNVFGDNKQELLDKQGIVIPWHDEAFKVWNIRFDPDKIVSGETVIVQFKLVARDLELDVPSHENYKGNAPEYSQLQTLPEYYFNLQITKP